MTSPDVLQNAIVGADSNHDRATEIALKEVVEVSLALQDPHKAFISLFSHITGWDSSDSYSNVEISRISGAMTNLVYLAHNPTAPFATAKVIIRIFGRGSLLFSRHQERGIFLAASKLKIGPQCLVEFGNGRVEQFLPGAAVTAASMRQPEIAAAIATALSNFHITMFSALPLIREEAGDQLQGSSPRSNVTGLEDALWERLRGWLAAATAEAPTEILELGLEDAEAEIEAMKEAAEREWGPAWLALTHNDLQYGNVLLGGTLDNGEPTKTSTATLIDYEYCTVGDIAFDIANHFCEYAADYHKSEEEMLNWGRLPTPAEEAVFCRAYVESLFKNHPESLLAMKLQASCGIAPSKQLQTSYKQEGVEELEDTSGLSTWCSSSFVETVTEVLIERVHAYMPLSHLKWGLWGIIQSKFSEVEFDYMEYARKRLQQYHATKEILLQS